MGRLSDMGIPVFRTDKQGTIIAVSDGTNISWSQEPCNDYSSGDSSVNASAGGTGGNSWQEETTTSDLDTCLAVSGFILPQLGML